MNNNYIFYVISFLFNILFPVQYSYDSLFDWDQCENVAFNKSLIL